MAYKYDANDVNNGLVKEGDYEALIERMEIKTTPNGKNKLSVMYRIRSDVEQAYGNKVIFEDIWSEKDNPEVFNRKRINQLLGTQKVQDGQEFASINEIIKFLDNAPLIIHVSIEFDTWKEDDVNTVSFYKKTKVVPQKVDDLQDEGAMADVPEMPQSPEEPKEEQPAPAAEQPAKEGVVIGDDDLPF